jgi:hypothetical protein
MVPAWREACWREREQIIEEIGAGNHERAMRRHLQSEHDTGRFGEGT